MKIKKIVKMNLLLAMFVMLFSCNVQAATKTMDDYLMFHKTAFQKANPKVTDKQYQESEAWVNFLKTDMYEGWTLFPLFDVYYYLGINNLNGYEDIKAHPYKHFIEYGLEEGRPISYKLYDIKNYKDTGRGYMSFDKEGYLKHNPEIKGDKYFASHPYEHYILFGAAEGRTAVHTWDKGTVTKAATCTDDGVKTFKCKCGETRTEKIKATGNHTWDDGSETEKATCQKEGTKTFKCTKCEETKTEVIGKSEHDYKNVATTATCETEGKYYKECRNCKEREMTTNSKGEEVVKYYTGKIDHNYTVLTSTEEATCEHPGHEVYTCSICGKANQTKETSKKLDHDFTAEDAHHAKKDATCLVDGNPEYYTCGGTCGKNYATNDVNATEALESIVIPAPGHSYVETVIPATCEEDGERISKCSKCDSKLTVKIEKTNHAAADQTLVAAVAANCYKAGNPEYKKCVCGKYFATANTGKINGTKKKAGAELTAEEIVLPATNAHTWGEWRTTQEATEDTCLEETRECTVEGCGASEVRTGHSRAKMESAATCTEPEVDLCAKCGKQYKTGAALGHNMVADAENSVAATCTEAGVIATKCSREGCTHKVTTPEQATGHTLGEKVVAKSAKCEETGNIDYFECSGCHKYFVEDENGTVTIGNKKYTEKAEADVKIPSLGHKWDNGTETTPATCEEDGLRTYTCVNEGCDYGDASAAKTTTEVINKLGHDWTKVPAKAETCTTEGNETEYYTCKNEADKYYVLATGDETAETDVTIEGKRYKQTSTEPDAISATGHDFTSAGIVEKTKVESSDNYTAKISFYCANGCGENTVKSALTLTAVKDNAQKVTGYTVTDEGKTFTFDAEFNFKSVATAQNN